MRAVVLSDGRGARPGETSIMVDPATPHYPVLLLSEEQIAQLLQRQSMRTIDARFAPPSLAFNTYARLMRRVRIVMVALLLISAGAGAWVWAPLPVLAAFPWATEEAPPALATGASFSLTVASSRSADEAAGLARRLAAGGTPSYVRAGALVHHVMVGPYVSLEEVETEQRRLARGGVSGSRVFVDDSLRKTPASAPVIAAPGNPALVLVGAGRQVSLALEFEQAPDQVTTKRGADGTVVVEMGPIASAIETQEWSAPPDVSLLRQMKVEEIVGAPGTRHARATLLMPRSTMARARVEGRRVYIDVMTAPPPPPRKASPASVRKPLAERVAASQVAAMTPAPSAVAIETPGPASADALRPVIARMERMVPFLQSATRTASADVLRALASNVAELDAALRQVAATPEIADSHSALSAATASARRAVDAGFGGDRVAEAHQAGMFLDAAKTALGP